MRMKKYWSQRTDSYPERQARLYSQRVGNCANESGNPRLIYTDQYHYGRVSYLNPIIGKRYILLSTLTYTTPLCIDLPSILNLNYFTRTSSSSTPNSNVCMERETFFVQIQPDSRPLDKLLFIQTGKDFFPGNIFHLLPEHIIIRREWQTFRKLPKSDTIVFTVKTSVERLVDLPENEKAKLVKEIRAWPREIATYKGRDLWQRAVIGFCEDRTAMVLDDTDLKSEMGTLTRASDD